MHKAVGVAALFCLFFLSGCNATAPGGSNVVGSPPPAVSGGGGSPPDGGSSNNSSLDGQSWYQQFLAQSGVDWPQTGIVSFQAISGADSRQNHVPITIGQIFAEDAVDKGQSVVASDGGRTIPI